MMDVTCSACFNMADKEAMMITCTSLVLCARAYTPELKSKNHAASVKDYLTFVVSFDTFDTTRCNVHNKSSWAKVH